MVFVGVTLNCLDRHPDGISPHHRENMNFALSISDRSDLKPVVIQVGPLAAEMLSKLGP